MTLKDRFHKFITNNGRFDIRHPEYRRVCLLNSILIIMMIVFMSFTVLSMLGSYDPPGILTDAVALVIAAATLLYFHKTDKLQRSTNMTVVIFLAALFVYFNLTQNANYAFCWIGTIPPVLYFLLDAKKARPVIDGLKFHIGRQQG